MMPSLAALAERRHQIVDVLHVMPQGRQLDLAREETEEIGELAAVSPFAVRDREPWRFGVVLVVTYLTQHIGQRHVLACGEQVDVADDQRTVAVAELPPYGGQPVRLGRVEHAEPAAGSTR